MRLYLETGWEVASAAPGAVAGPDSPALQGLQWIATSNLGTVAAMLRAVGRWSFSSSERLDGQDWWYRLKFQSQSAVGNAAPAGAAVTLGFDGLATLAEVWLNGEHLLASDNQFLAHVISAHLRPGENELLLQFKSLDAALQGRRPRPRWRAPMVEHQQLRWFRTTLLGRTPGWSPPAPGIGPWRPIWIQAGAPLLAEPPCVQASVDGERGTVRATCRLNRDSKTLTQAELVVARDGQAYRAALKTTQDGSVCVLNGELNIDAVERWWPHTHGDPALYEVRVELRGAAAGSSVQSLQLGRVGFRTVRLDRAGGNFALHVNGERIFCRGACWTPPDVVALDTPQELAAQAIEQLTSAGMNMVRVGGTMVYENAAFLDACDERGVLLWQDFMFANMDYPSQDAQFAANVAREARQVLQQLSGRACLAVLCGNSEGEQQAAMWGAPRELWSHHLFHELLPQLCAADAPEVPYWPSSTHGGAFPHQSNVGTSSYYGVGAYLRPLTDARRAQVRFATECLAFANVPQEEMLAELSRLGGAKVHSPLWKARVPRDLGAGWDFDDVRDHYLREIFDLDPLTVRYAEHERYLDLSRAVIAEVMAAAFREWRCTGSVCNGALLWFLKDLWPGAGWGIIDANGDPKSGYYALARVLQPRAVLLTDEGGNGLTAHLVNESPIEFVGVLQIGLIHANGRTLHQRLPISVPPRQTVAVPVASLLEGFSDLTYAYRFGPAPYEAVQAVLLDGKGAQIADDFHFLLGHRRMNLNDPELAATAQRLASGDLLVSITAQKLARFVTLSVAGFRATDQYFHLAPGAAREVLMRKMSAAADGASGEVRALNSTVVGKIIAG